MKTLKETAIEMLAIAQEINPAITDCTVSFSSMAVRSDVRYVYINPWIGDKVLWSAYGNDLEMAKADFIKTLQNDNA